MAYEDVSKDNLTLPELHKLLATRGLDDGAMTLPQFFKWAGIGHTKTYAEAKLGRLKLTRIGGRTVVVRSDARVWLAYYAANSEKAA